MDQLSTLPSEMKAARLIDPVFKYHLVPVPVPSPGPREILIKVRAAGYCHTDSLMPLSPTIGGPLPLTGSHEPAGVVVGMGDKVEQQGKFRVGDRVMAVNTARACGQCSLCKYHDERFCPDCAEIGLRGVDGAFAEYCLIDAKYTVKVPYGMGWEQAAPLSCAGVTIWHSIKRANLKSGQILGICGIGALGSLGVQMAKAIVNFKTMCKECYIFIAYTEPRSAEGLKVVAIDARDAPLQLAETQRLSPDLAINAIKTTPQETLRRIDAMRPDGWDQGSGVDALVMATPAPLALEYALTILRPFCLLVLTAGPRDLSIYIGNLIFRGITITGTKNGTAEDLAEATALCVKEGIKSSVTTFGFSQTEMDRLVEEVGRHNWAGKAVVLVDP